MRYLADTENILNAHNVCFALTQQSFDMAAKYETCNIMANLCLHV